MILVIALAIALSMDAFSLALCLGTLNFSYKKMLMISVTVGIFHFIMPIIGMYIAEIILKFVILNPKYISFIVFFILGLFMIFDKNETNVNKIFNIFSIVLFALLVSIDSFVAGIGLENIYNNHIVCALTFTIFSSLFTLSGLFLGKYINSKIGNVSKLIGGIILIVLSIHYLTN